MSYYCNICKKEYKSYKSMWNHNNIVHSEQNIIINRNDNKTRKFECSNCSKKFTTKQSLIHHNENTCKNKDSNKTKDNLNEIIKLQNKVIELEKKIIFIEQNINYTLESKSNLSESPIDILKKTTKDIEI
jgi:DNA-directed RNA polymerase subunit RPC12/RpoP